ncbi:hypothetical protein PanWU01x14_308470 [Parasponia andersonii]|uniref:Uncharacterized protein n=1 Tax=Parasponia andersonii TaxID=3476 RepID=A0A2P5AR12_PARAD|nr:hypothetical protein PanWU01x14_308470 [Parasponia andersonii]
MALSSNSGSLGISLRGSSSPQLYPLSSSLDIILSLPLSSLPISVSPRVDQASMDNLQAQYEHPKWTRSLRITLLNPLIAYDGLRGIRIVGTTDPKASSIKLGLPVS